MAQSVLLQLADIQAKMEDAIEGLEEFVGECVAMMERRRAENRAVAEAATAEYRAREEKRREEKAGQTEGRVARLKGGMGGGGSRGGR